MTKSQQLVERIIVTFFQAAIAYAVVLPNPSLSKTAIAGGIGAGLSAVYNVLRQSNPTIVSSSATTPTFPPIVPEKPLNDLSIAPAETPPVTPPEVPAT